MQLIAVDIGNSSIKVAWRPATEDDRWAQQFEFHDSDPIEFGSPQFVSQHESAFWSVSSVNQNNWNRLESWISNHRPQDNLHLVTADEIDLKTDVHSRQQLGKDRLIAAWQAVQIHGQGPLVVVDAGTAVTVDFVDKNEVFQGGLIFPGATTNLQSLADNTDALPNLSDHDLLASTACHSELFQGIGRSTDESILRGVYQSQLAAIKDLVTNLLSKNSDRPGVYVTGGGIPMLLEQIPAHWNYVPDLVLNGANAIGACIMSRQDSDHATD